MAIIRICNYFISTNYKRSEVKEKFEESLSSFIEEMDPDVNFDLALFVESLTEDGEDFELLSEIDEDDAEIEYNEEDVDAFVDKVLNAYVDEEDVEDDDDDVSSDSGDDFDE